MLVQGNEFSPWEHQGGEGGDVPAPVSWDGLLQPHSQWEVPHCRGAAALPDSLPAPSTSPVFIYPFNLFAIKNASLGARGGRSIRWEWAPTVHTDVRL